MGWYLGYTIIYFVLMFAVGFYYFTKVKTSDDYLIAGWNMGFWSIVGTKLSTSFGAAVFIGWVGMGFTVGLSGYFKFTLPTAIAGLLLIIFFAKSLRRQKLYTIADLFSERFGNATGIIPSILSAFIYSVPTTALQIIAMATLFQMTFKLDYKIGIFIAFALILGFTILGGLKATIVTDAFQSIVIVVGIIILFIASVIYGGGFKEILKNTPSEYLSPTGPDGLNEVLLFALSVAPFYLIWQSTWQRIFAAKTEGIAKNAGIMAFAIGGVISFLPFAIGLTARNYVPLDMEPDLVFSYVTTELLPPAIGGIIIVALLSALMTGADSFILQGSSNLTQDLYYRLINPNADEKKMMLVSRLTVVIIAILALIISYNITGIIDIYQWALRISAAALVLPFLAVMFWRRTTKAGVIGSMLLATIATLIWPYLGISIDHTIFAFTVSLVSLVVISLLTKHSKTEQVRAVYWEDLDSAEKT